MAAESQVIERLAEQVEQRYQELNEQLVDPETMADRARYTDVARRHRQLKEAHRIVENYRRAMSDAAGAEELLGGDGTLEPEERREFQELVAASQEEIEQLAERLRLAMVESDPNDDKNVIVEIRGGAGGDEAALFAADLYRMLTKYAERRGFKTEVIGQ